MGIFVLGTLLCEDYFDPMSYAIDPYDPCPCGSGEKYKFCCAAKTKGVIHGKYPRGTVDWYGPDDKTVTKIIAGVVMRDGHSPIREKWEGLSVRDDPKIAEEIRRFFAKHGVKAVHKSNGVVGCPHEEGVDHPFGQDCPLCPFWAGKQARHYPEKPGSTFAPHDDTFDDEEDENNGGDETDEDFGEGEEEPDDVEGDDLDECIERFQAIVGEGGDSMDDAMHKAFAHLKASLRLPCLVKGIEDFRWEERYVIGGWSRQEYNRLKKTQPSYTDHFELVDIAREEYSQWMMFEEDLYALVRRKSDGKEFVLGLAELEAVDKTSPNYQLLRDFAVWFVNNR
jgi:hypothetical protein